MISYYITSNIIIDSLTQPNPGGVMSFPDFLDVMHQHGGGQKVAGEILAAFRATDPGRGGVISAQQLRHTLLHWGERLSTREGEGGWERWWEAIAEEKS